MNGQNTEELDKFKKILNNKNEVYLRVKANPGAAFNKIKEIMAGEIIKIDIAAPAQKGKANQALMKFLAQEFGVNKNGVRIISGAGERLKLIKINK